VPSSVNLSDASTPPPPTLPILFWIHGGFFYEGAGTSPVFSGRWLCNATNTIVISINSRLGAYLQIFALSVCLQKYFYGAYITSAFTKIYERSNPLSQTKWILVLAVAAFYISWRCFMFPEAQKYVYLQKSHKDLFFHQNCAWHCILTIGVRNNSWWKRTHSMFPFTTKNLCEI